MGTASALLSGSPDVEGMALGPAHRAGSLRDQLLEQRPYLRLGDLDESAAGDGRDRGEDVAHEIRPPRPDILVGGIEQRFDGDLHRLVARQVGTVAFLKRRTCVLTTRAGCVIVVFLVAAAGDVVLEYAAEAAPLVEPGEQRHHYQTLHRGGPVAAEPLGQLGWPGLQRQTLALHLLVMLELGLEQAHELDRRTGGARDRHRRHVVGGEYFL